MSSINYSRWDHIEVSDDEDDTHPNIDTPSLFKWRHEARLKRDEEFRQEKKEIEEGYQEHNKKFSEMKNKYNEAKKNNSPDLEKIEKDWNEMLKLDKDWTARYAEFKKKEKGKSFSVINHVEKEAEKEDDPEKAVERLKKFVEDHEDEIKKFGYFQKHEDTRKYLLDHPHLLCEETTNHLLLWCIDLAMEEKFSLMDHISRQCIIMQFMLELRKSKKCSPNELINLFYSKLVDPEPEYQKAFDDELQAFRTRIRDRAKVRIQEATEKYEMEERTKRLGPGGLDPIEVMEELPEKLKKCFISRDTNMLKEVFSAMEPKDAKKWYQKCVDSGLWVENAKDLEESDEPKIEELDPSEDA